MNNYSSFLLHSTVSLSLKLIIFTLVIIFLCFPILTGIRYFKNKTQYRLLIFLFSLVPISVYFILIILAQLGFLY